MEAPNAMAVSRAFPPHLEQHWRGATKECFPSRRPEYKRRDAGDHWHQFSISHLSENNMRVLVRIEAKIGLENQLN